MSDTTQDTAVPQLMDALDLEQLTHEIREHTGRELRVEMIPEPAAADGDAGPKRVSIPADDASGGARASGAGGAASWLAPLYPVDIPSLVEEAFDEDLLRAPPPEDAEPEEDDGIPVDIDLGEESPEQGEAEKAADPAGAKSGAAGGDEAQATDPALRVSFDSEEAVGEGAEEEDAPAAPPPVPAPAKDAGEAGDGVETATGSADPEAFDEESTTEVETPEAAAKAVPPPPPEDAKPSGAAVEEASGDAAVPPPPPEAARRAEGVKPPPPPEAAGKAEGAPDTPPPPPAEAREGKKKKKKKKFKKPWFEEFFDDDYLRTLPYMTDAMTVKESKYIEAHLTLEAEQTVLDVGCGYGRHAIQLARMGYEVTGIDTSLPLLIKAAEITREAGVEVNFMHQDMREMTFQDEYDAAYCVMTSFGYFDDDTNRDVLQRVYRAVKPGGRFLLEVINRDFILQDLPSRVWWEGDDCVVMDEVEFNFLSSRVVSKRSVVFGDGRSINHDMSIRAYCLHELGRLLHNCGFKVTAVTGNHATEQRFFGPDSPYLIILSEKN